jgi:hypothetical protein
MSHSIGWPMPKESQYAFASNRPMDATTCDAGASTVGTLVQFSGRYATARGLHAQLQMPKRRWRGTVNAIAALPQLLPRVGACGSHPERRSSA